MHFEEKTFLCKRHFCAKDAAQSMLDRYDGFCALMEQQVPEIPAVCCIILYIAVILLRD